MIPKSEIKRVAMSVAIKEKNKWTVTNVLKE